MNKTRHHIGQLRSDLDNGNNSFQYKLLGAGAGTIFVIDERTGDLYAERKLDREERSLYTLRAQVIDTTTGKAVEPESEFVIRVSDINDNEPKFLDEPYEAIVPEMSPEGTLVIQVTASDADDPSSGNNARLLYSLLQGQPYFSIEPTTGKIMAYDNDIGENAEMDYSIEDDSETFDVITNNETQEGIIILKKKVDFEHQNYYRVRAKVKNRHVAEHLREYHTEPYTTLIKVQVEDDDEPPVFLFSYYIFEILEGSPLGSSVGTVSATDPDQRQSPIGYSITRSKVFSIDNNGTITTTNNLDREISAWYNLTVTAVEKANAEQMSSVPVYVQVLNINDHAPELSEYYEPYVCENAGSGQVIQTISAVDRDESIEDHHFRFNLSVEEKNSSFTIIDNEDNTAVILTNRNGFSLQEEPVFYVSILIADNGIPSLTSTNTLTIHVCDCDSSGGTQTCSDRDLMLSMGFRTEVVVAVLICIMVIFGLKQRRKQTLFPEKSEDLRENIFRRFILEKLEEADTDPCAPPFDSLQTYAFEGTGSLAGSLSSLESAASDQEENYDFLNELGPRFKRLACMFGSAVQSNN
ncbi:cadherin-19 [Camelus ferus]|nr:cadherin-19 [Camelus ferus]